MGKCKALTGLAVKGLNNAVSFECHEVTVVKLIN